MAFFVTNIAPQQLTGLTIVRANEIWLTNPLTDVTQEIREIFVPFANISTVYEQTHDIGQGRSYTTIEWNEPTRAGPRKPASLFGKFSRTSRSHGV